MNMITNFKIFEKLRVIEYSKGDTVVCIDNSGYPLLNIGEKYKVIKLYRVDEEIKDYMTDENVLVYIDGFELLFAFRFVSEEKYKEMLFKQDIKNFNL